MRLDRSADPRYEAGQKAVAALARQGTPWKEQAKIIGLTGAIASGKTTVANELASRGAILVDGDVISRELVQVGKPTHQAILDEFGPEVMTTEGELDRKKLGTLVFSDEKALLRLNEITHPAIWEEMTRQVLAAALQAPVVVMVMPLLLEHMAESLVEQVWVTDISDEMQLQRLMERDHSTREAALGRVKSQMLPSEKREFADVLIDNNGSLESTMEQVDRAWRDLHA